jgi:hypothetical protein
MASFTERYGAILLASILLLALWDWESSLYADFLLRDERIYGTWAQKAALGAVSPLPVTEFDALPAY